MRNYKQSLKERRNVNGQILSDNYYKTRNEMITFELSFDLIYFMAILHEVCDDLTTGFCLKFDR